MLTKSFEITGILNDLFYTEVPLICNYCGGVWYLNFETLGENGMFKCPDCTAKFLLEKVTLPIWELSYRICMYQKPN